MTGRVVRFPPRAIFLTEGEGAWLTITPRGHGWVDGDHRSALRTAAWLGANHQLPVRELNPRGPTARARAMQMVQLARRTDIERPCCENLALVHPTPDGPHAAELRCAGCGKHRGWLPREALTFLEQTTRRFGAPSTPLVLRDQTIGDHQMINKQTRENSGILFKNDRRQSENSPDYTGECNINGELFFMNAWIKTGARGKFMSFSFKSKAAAESKPAATTTGNDFHNDPIGF